MQFDKETVLNFMRQEGMGQQADQAAQQLPDQVDHEQHAGLLQSFGVDPKQLMSRLSGA